MENLTQLITSLRETSSASDAKIIIQELDKIPIQNEGLNRYQLEVLIGIITDTYSHVSVASKTHILKNYLFFKELISTSVVLKILSSVGVRSETNLDKRLSTSLQVRLVDWLVTVYSLLDERDIIERLYSLVFNLLEFEFIRPKIAHLLFLATRKKHVSQVRVDMLRSVYTKYEESESLIALLLLYQQYAPDKLFDIFPSVSKNVFAHPDEEYLMKLYGINSSFPIEIFNDEITNLDDFSRKLKKRKTGRQNNDILLIRSSIPEVVNSTESLINHLHEIKTKREWLSILNSGNSWLQIGLALLFDETIASRMDAWGSLQLDNSDEKLDSSLPAFVNFGKLVFDHSIYSTFDVSLQKTDNLKTLLRSLRYFYITDDLIELIQKINGELVSSDPTSISEFIDALSYLVEFRKNHTSKDILNRLITALIEYSQKYLEITSNNIVVLLSVLNFLKVSSRIPKSSLDIKNLVLPQPLINRILFSNHPIATSEICSYLNYAKTFLRTADSNDEVTRFTDLHNSYVIDICNLIWRNRAFDIPKSSYNTSFGLTSEFYINLSNNLPIFDRNFDFKSFFNIHNSPAFASMSAQSLRDLEDKDTECVVTHEGPLTHSSASILLKENQWLKKPFEDIRIDILKDIELKGYAGVADLLFSHLKSLLNKR